MVVIAMVGAHNQPWLVEARGSLLFLLLAILCPLPAGNTDLLVTSCSTYCLVCPRTVEECL